MSTSTANIKKAVFLGGKVYFFEVDTTKSFKDQVVEFVTQNSKKIIDDYINGINEYNLKIDNEIRAEETKKVSQKETRKFTNEKIVFPPSFNKDDCECILTSEVLLEKLKSDDLSEVLCLRYINSLNEFCEFDSYKDDQLLIASLNDFFMIYPYGWEIVTRVIHALNNKSKLNFEIATSSHVREILEAIDTYLVNENGEKETRKEVIESRLKELISFDFAAEMLNKSEEFCGVYGNVLSDFPKLRSIILVLAFQSDRTVSSQSAFIEKKNDIKKYQTELEKIYEEASNISERNGDNSIEKKASKFKELIQKTKSQTCYDYHFYRSKIREKQELLRLIASTESSDKSDKWFRIRLLMKFEPFLRLCPQDIFFQHWLLEFNTEAAKDCIRYLLEDFDTKLKNFITLKGNIPTTEEEDGITCDPDLDDGDDKFARVVIRSILKAMCIPTKEMLELNDPNHPEEYTFTRDHTGFDRIAAEFPYFLDKMRILDLHDYSNYSLMSTAVEHKCISPQFLLDNFEYLESFAKTIGYPVFQHMIEFGYINPLLLDEEKSDTNKTIAYEIYKRLIEHPNLHNICAILFSVKSSCKLKDIKEKVSKDKFAEYVKQVISHIDILNVQKYGETQQVMTPCLNSHKQQVLKLLT